MRNGFCFHPGLSVGRWTARDHYENMTGLYRQEQYMYVLVRPKFRWGRHVASFILEPGLGIGNGVTILSEFGLGFQF